jgi:hypothetical protein
VRGGLLACGCSPATGAAATGPKALSRRAPSIPDLIIAAAAELAGLTVLHLGKDFELIAQITGQPMERLSMTKEQLPTQVLPGAPP